MRRGGPLPGRDTIGGSTMSLGQPANAISRRTFLGVGTCAAAVAPGLPALSVLRAAEPPARRRTVGIQVGAVSFTDEGTDKVLDVLQERGAVDTLYLTTFTYGRGLAGRQVPGQPFPDHGVRESDERFFRGGNYATPHPEFYRDTVLKQTRAQDHGDLDIRRYRE